MTIKANEIERGRTFFFFFFDDTCQKGQEERIREERTNLFGRSPTEFFVGDEATVSEAKEKDGGADHLTEGEEVGSVKTVHCQDSLVEEGDRKRREDCVFRWFSCLNVMSAQIKSPRETS